MKIRTGFVSLTIVAILILGVVLGCGGSGAACIGSVTYEGKLFEGGGKDELAAKEGACNNYCRDADPEYDARYRIWVDSPKGKAKGSPTKQKALFEDKDLFAYVTETCARKCLAEMKPSAKCK